jgi:hypothetical protein
MNSNLTTDVMTCDDIETYHQVCMNNDVFEKISDDEPVHPYFDIDYSEKSKTGAAFDDVSESDVIEWGSSFITYMFQEMKQFTPAFSVTASSSPSYMCSKDKVLKWKVSVHLIVTNCLIYKSEMKHLVSKLNEFLDGNAEFYSLYYKAMGDMGGSFFDESVYNPNQKLRAWNASKEGENRPMVLVKGTFKESIVTNLDGDTLPAFHFTPKPQAEVNEEGCNMEINAELVGKYRELLAMIKLTQRERKDRSLWMHICCVLKDNGFEEEDWLQFGVNQGLNMDTEKENLFYDMRSDGNNSVAVLKKLAKRDSPEEYEAWRIRHHPATCLLPFAKFSESVSHNSMKAGAVVHNSIKNTAPEPLPLHVFSKGEYDVAKHIAPYLKQTIKFCNKIWYVCGENHIWMESTNPPLSTIITHIQNQLVKARARNETAFASELEKTTDTEGRKQMEDKHSKEVEGYNKAYRTASQAGFSNQMVKLLSQLLFEHEFYQKLDGQKYVIAYQNGVLNMKTGEFREGILPEDYLTKTLAFDYVRLSDTHKDVVFVRNELLKICNNDEAHLNYFCSAIGVALTGDASHAQELYLILG